MTIKEIEQNRDSLIDSLVKEESELLKKIEKSRKDDDYGLYKNLIRALTDVTTLKQRELANIPRDRWIERFSHYYEGREVEKGDNEYIATWEQKGDEIRNHKVYKIEKEVQKPKYISLYTNSVCLDSRNDEEFLYTSIEIPIPNEVKAFDESELILVTKLGNNKYNSEEKPYWVSCYGKIKDGFIILQGNNMVIDKNKNKYNKDLLVKYEIIKMN